MVEDYARCSHVRPRTAVMAMTALPGRGLCRDAVPTLPKAIKPSS